MYCVTIGKQFWPNMLPVYHNASISFSDCTRDSDLCDSSRYTFNEFLKRNATETIGCPSYYRPLISSAAPGKEQCFLNRRPHRHPAVVQIAVMEQPSLGARGVLLFELGLRSSSLLFQTHVERCQCIGGKLRLRNTGGFISEASKRGILSHGGRPHGTHQQPN